VGCLEAIGVQNEANRNEQKRSPQNMTKLLGPPLTKLVPPSVRKRHRRSDNEHEGGLNQIPENPAFPLHMHELARERTPSKIILQTLQSQPGRHHGQHDKASVDVDRGDARG
jgi:hypothetical protein